MGGSTVEHPDVSSKVGENWFTTGNVARYTALGTSTSTPTSMWSVSCHSYGVLLFKVDLLDRDKSSLKSNYRSPHSASTVTLSAGSVVHSTFSENSGEPYESIVLASSVSTVSYSVGAAHY